MRFPVFLLVLLAASPAAAQTLLHPMFADHAVLERDQPIPVYGQARPGADISLQMGVQAHPPMPTRMGDGASPCPPCRPAAPSLCV